MLIDLTNPDVKAEFNDLFAKAVEPLERHKETLLAEAKAERQKRQDLDAKLKEFDGLDPAQIKALMQKIESSEEAKLIAEGKMDDVIARRIAKQQAEYERQLVALNHAKELADKKAQTYERKVLESHILRAAAGKVHESVIKSGDLTRAALEVFKLDESGNAVQFDENGSVVLGKDGKTAFNPAEWLEGMKETASHWFPSGNSGGGSQGSKSISALPKDFSHLPPAERLAAARVAGIK